MKKEDNKLNIKIFCLIAENNSNIFKIYYYTYESFIKEFKYYIYMGYNCQVSMINRELIV